MVGQRPVDPSKAFGFDRIHAGKTAGGSEARGRHERSALLSDGRGGRLMREGWGQGQLRAMAVV